MREIDYIFFTIYSAIPMCSSSYTNFYTLPNGKSMCFVVNSNARISENKLFLGLLFKFDTWLISKFISSNV